MNTKTCPGECGRTYTREEFLALKVPDNGSDRRAGMVWRNCVCGSTITMRDFPALSPVAELVIDDDQRCSWAEFSDAHASDGGLLDEVAQALSMYGEYHGGGGAEPEYVVQMATCAGCGQWPCHPDCSRRPKADIEGDRPWEKLTYLGYEKEPS